MSFVLHVKHMSQQHTLKLPEDPTVGSVVEKLQELTGLSIPTMKLMGPKLFKGSSVLSLAHIPLEERIENIGLSTGAKISLLGSRQSEVEALQCARAKEASLRMPTFEHADLMAARRRRTARPVAPPTGTPYTFQDYQVLPERTGMFPAPSEAMKLLHRLAGDRGIVQVMRDNQFQVGSLREMPPEGLVGISETCILGYNVNKGQEIYLRLRTDDGKGFRKYRSILRTLVHELTHNVHGPHDNKFKALCSKLSSDVNAVNARLSYGGHHAVQGLHGGYIPKDDIDLQADEREQHAAMAASQASSGKTLRQLAAEARQQQRHQAATRQPDVNEAAEVEQDRDEQEDVAFAYEHKDAETEQLESRFRQLEQ